MVASTPQRRCQQIYFNGYTLPTPMASATVLTAGTPAVTMTSGGFVRLSLDTTNEVQVARLSNGDVLPWDIDNIEYVEWYARVSASLAAACSLSMGLASAANTTVNSITARAMFRMTGGGSLVLDAVDGTNSQTSIATGLSMFTSDWQRFRINLKQGTITQGPPTSNVGGVGGKASIQFGCDDARGNLRHLAPRTQMSMAAYTSNLQLYFQLQKSANAASGSLDIRDIAIAYRL